MTESKKKIPEDVLGLSDAISKSLTLDVENGILREGNGEPLASSETAYSRNLPEGLTKEVVAQISDYNQLFATAGRHAVGMAALEAFKQHQDLKEITCELAYAGPKDSITIDVDRSRVFNYHINGENQSVTKFGASTVKVTTNYGKNSSAMKAVNEAILSAASLAFGK